MLSTGYLFALHILLLAKTTVTEGQPTKSELFCSKTDVLMNDCNVCRCVKYRFVCDARNCENVDMFGHFQDTIQTINVGMEGRGVWRTRPEVQQCQPGIHYSRNRLLCICSANGTWPNPICRDIFRVLREVEVAKTTNLPQDCEVSKLYLVSCNACICPSTARLDSQFCTNKTCANDDPAVQIKNATLGDEIEKDPYGHTITDFYADCRTDSLYNYGCRTCVCITNNRMICGKCSDQGDKNTPPVFKAIENPSSKPTSTPKVK